jgi:hypothetical protein
VDITLLKYKTFIGMYVNDNAFFDDVDRKLRKVHDKRDSVSMTQIMTIVYLAMMMMYFCL